MKPAVILCKLLQQDDVRVVKAIKAILKTSKAIEKQATHLWSSYSEFALSTRMDDNAYLSDQNQWCPDIMSEQL